MKFSGIINWSIINHSWKFQFEILKDFTKKWIQIDWFFGVISILDQSVWILFWVESFGFSSWNFQEWFVIDQLIIPENFIPIKIIYPNRHDTKKPIYLNPVLGRILWIFNLKFAGMIYNWSINHPWKFHPDPRNFNFCSIFIKNDGFSLCFFSIFEIKLKLLGFQWNFYEWFID